MIKRPGKIHELPEWLVKDRKQLTDMTKTHRKGGSLKYQLTETFEEPAKARRLAQRLEDRHIKTKIVKVINEFINKPSYYSVYAEIKK